MRTLGRTNLYDIYISRPFITRNADEYDLENVLDLFVDPTDGLSGPFDFSNNIIKGKMGSGKTMYLRANYAYYLYTLVPCLLDNLEIVLPAYIKLSDFQHLHEPEEIYQSILIKIIEEIVSAINHLRSADELARLHKGACSINGLWTTDKVLLDILTKLRTYDCQEYVRTVSKGLAVKGTLAAKFANVCHDYSKNEIVQIKEKGTPSFDDVVHACENLILPFNGKLLLLFDEVGSIDKRFFNKTKNNDSLFETLMNQLRTLPYIRTKLAIYPKTQSDILRETRYGDVVSLEENINLDAEKYTAFISKTTSLIEKYVEKSSGMKIDTEHLFDISVDNQAILEQLINASDGNMRRLVHLLDLAMNESFKRHSGKEKVSLEDANTALKKQGESLASNISEKNKALLDNIINVCKTRNTFKFTFPNRSNTIDKFTSNSNEYNVIYVLESGTGRKSTLYAFDYAFCVYKDIPTHYIKNTNKIDKTRSFKTGNIISKTTKLDDDLLLQSNIPGKILGKITYIGTSNTKESGFITGEDGIEYYFSTSNIIKSDRKNNIYVNCEVRFNPVQMSKDLLVASNIELIG